MEILKKYLLGLLLGLFGTGIVIGLYQPSAVEINNVDNVGDKLITIIDNKFDSNYQFLLNMLNNFDSRVVDSEKNQWILSRLKLIIITVMQNTASKNNCPQLGCTRDIDIPRCLDGKQITELTKYDVNGCPLPCKEYSCN